MKDNYLNYVLTYNNFETYKCYEHHLSIILNYLFFNFNLKNSYDVKDYHLFEFIKFQKKKNLSNSTINKRLNVFKRMYKFFKLNDFSNVFTLKEAYTTFNSLNLNEIKKLVNYIKNSNLCLQNKLILSLMLSSGIRRSELIKIKVSNIDLDNNSILLTKTKTGNSRFIFFDDFTRYYLIKFLKNHKYQYLFNIKLSAIDSLFRRVKKVCNFRKFSPHVLRHTYATILVNNDTNLEFIRITLGHTNLNTTKRYLHYNTNNLLKTYKTNFNYSI